MKKFKRVFVFLLVAIVEAESRAGMTPGDPWMYRERLARIREMAARSPGYIGLGFNDVNLGAWAGIEIQTRWQMETGRDALPIWQKINYALTFEPSEYFRLYVAGKRCADSNFITRNPTRSPESAPIEASTGARITRELLCERWREFFERFDRTRNPAFFLHIPSPASLALGEKARAQRMLWRNHALAIEHAIWQHDLDGTSVQGIPELERRYWTGWVRFVHILAEENMPTTEIFIAPLAASTSPACAPLGAAGCRLTDLPATKGQFVRMMADGEADLLFRALTRPIARFLDSYRR